MDNENKKREYVKGLLERNRDGSLLPGESQLFGMVESTKNKMGAIQQQASAVRKQIDSLNAQFQNLEAEYLQEMGKGQGLIDAMYAQYAQTVESQPKEELQPEVES